MTMGNSDDENGEICLTENTMFQHVADDLEILRQIQVLKFLAVPPFDLVIIHPLLFGFIPQLLIELLRVRAEISAHDDTLISA